MLRFIAFAVVVAVLQQLRKITIFRRDVSSNSFCEPKWKIVLNVLHTSEYVQQVAKLSTKVSIRIRISTQIINTPCVLFIGRLVGK